VLLNAKLEPRDVVRLLFPFRLRQCMTKHAARGRTANGIRQGGPERDDYSIPPLFSRAASHGARGITCHKEPWKAS
jgi:hypothetical protein